MAWFAEYEKYPSLRFRKTRFRNNVQYKPRVALIHWSAGSGDALALAKYLKAPTTTDKKTGEKKPRLASYHFGIGRPGEIFQIVDTDDTAWHAGDGELWTSLGHPSRVNEQSIGICLCNVGPAPVSKVAEDGVKYVEIQHTKPGFEAWKAYESYTEAQQWALLKVLRACKEAHPELKFLCGHQDVTRGKGDPGPLFESLDLANELRALQITRMVQDWDTHTWSPAY